MYGPIRSRSALRHLLAATLTLSLGVVAQAARAEDQSIHAKLPQATVTMNIPAAIQVGEKHELTVAVDPRDGQPSPTTVRARLGMPGHGHWITEESSHAYGSGTLSFPGEFPMPGKYRFRVWLDFPDGGQSRTAVDFQVAPGHNMAPVVVN